MTTTVTAATAEVAAGVRLAYDEAPGGDPAVVLVHGMACDRSQMRPLLDHLAGRHRVITLDLRGHGESDKPDGPYTFDAFGDDLLASFGALGLERPVLVGHSLGGSISLALAVARPDAVGGLVLLDSGLRDRSVRSADLRPFYATLGGPDHAELVRRFVVERLFEPDEDRAVVETVAATMAATPPHVFLSMADSVLGMDSAQLAADCTVPAMLVMSKRPFITDEALAGLGPNWMVGRVVGVGHFLQMLAPDQVNPMIDRFLDRLAATGQPGEQGHRHSTGPAAPVARPQDDGQGRGGGPAGREAS